jgi:hypothetical protein
MRAVPLALLAASAISVGSIGGAAAMPFANPSLVQETLVHDVRLVCDGYGRCYNTNRNARYYAPPSHRSAYRGGYRSNRAYGYRRAPSVGIGVGPVGIGVRTR